MTEESLTKALPNWGSAIEEDNIPVEPDFSMPDRTDNPEMTPNEIQSSYRQLENMIGIMRLLLLTDKQAEDQLDSKQFKRRRGWKEITDDKGWKNAKIKEIISSLETIRDKIKDPIPANVGELKLRGSKLSDSFPKGEKTWPEWVLEVANEFYQDFSARATKAKAETMLMFLARVRGGKAHWPRALRNFEPSPHDPKFSEKFTKHVNAIAGLPQEHIDSAAKFFNLKAGRTGEKKKVKVKTGKGLGGERRDMVSMKDVDEYFKPEEIEALPQKWASDEKELAKVKQELEKRKLARINAEKRRLASMTEEERQAETKEREMRQTAGVEYGDVHLEDRPSELHSNWETHMDNNLDRKQFKNLINEMKIAFKGEPLEKFTGIGIDILYDTLQGGAAADTEALVRNIDYHRKGIQKDKGQMRGDLTNFKESYIMNEMKLNKDEFEFELLDETLIGLNRLNKLRAKRSRGEADTDDRRELTEHYENKEKVRDKIGEVVASETGNIYAQYQNYVRQIQDVQAEIRQYKDDDDYAQKARELLSESVDLDTEVVWRAWGYKTDDELTSEEVIKAFGLTNEFETGVFVTLFFKYHLLGRNGWLKFLQQWFPVDAEKVDIPFRPYYPTGRTYETVSSDTFPDTFRALLSYVRLFINVEKDNTSGELQQYENMMGKMLDTFANNIDKIILLEERDSMNDHDRQLVMEFMVEDDGDETGKEVLTEQHPELAALYESKLGIGDDLKALDNFMKTIIELLPSLFLTELKKGFEKVVNNEVKYAGKQKRVNHKGKSMTLKEKLVDLEILTWGDE